MLTALRKLLGLSLIFWCLTNKMLVRCEEFTLQPFNVVDDPVTPVTTYFRVTDTGVTVAGTLCVQGAAGISVDGPAVLKGGAYLDYAGTPLISGANPTATVNGTAVNGSATTYLRSDGAPALADPLTPADATQNVTGGLTASTTIRASSAAPMIWSDYTGTGATAIAQTSVGMKVTGNAMNSANKYPGFLMFGSTDAQFTTTNPKIGAAIVGYATQTYNDDSDSGMGLEFFTTPNDAGTAPAPTGRFYIDEAGEIGNEGTPDANLEIVGTAMFGSTAAANGDYLSITSTSSTFGGFIDVADIETASISARDGTTFGTIADSSGNLTVPAASITLTNGDLSLDDISASDDITFNNLFGANAATAWVVEDYTNTLAGGAVSRVRLVNYILENVSGSQTLATIAGGTDLTTIIDGVIIANENGAGDTAVYKRHTAYEEDAATLTERIDEADGTDFESNAAYGISFAVSGTNIVLTVDSSTDTVNWTAVLTITTLNKG